MVRRIGPRIKSHENNFRKRHLATGNTYDDTAFRFRKAPNTNSLLVKEVCEAIVAEYASEVITTLPLLNGGSMESDLFFSKMEYS